MPPSERACPPSLATRPRSSFRQPSFLFVLTLPLLLLIKSSSSATAFCCMHSSCRGRLLFCALSRRKVAIWERTGPKFVGSSGVGRLWPPRGGGGISSLSSSTLSASSKKEATEPPTGWTHNKPSTWTNPDTKSSSESTTELRTGWLHNTKPKKESAAAAESSTPKETEAQRLLRLEKTKKMQNHRIIGVAFHPCGGDRRAVVTEHRISVPLSYTAEDDGGRIDLYFTVTELIDTEAQENVFHSLRSMTPEKRGEAYVQYAKMDDADGMVLYLQGGPGFGCPAPVVGLGMGEKGSWAGEALGKKDFKRIVLMDQRGTGRSTPITKQTLERRFPDLFGLDQIEKEGKTEFLPLGGDSGDTSIATLLERYGESHPDLSAKVGATAGEATKYMSHFRADNIVRDAETIREALLLPRAAGADESARPWGAALGQSFGGFCMMTYLSQVTNPPRICLLTGGIAPMLSAAYEVYDALWDRVKERNLRYYDRYPEDVPLVKKIVRRLLEEPKVILPSGGILTARRFLQLGLGLGGAPSAFPSMHALLQSAFVQDKTDNGKEEESPEFSRAFLKQIDSAQSFDDHPIYFLLHESIYADGPDRSQTNWAAHRTYLQRTKTPNEFSYDLTSKLDSNERPTLFFGEMVFPWMADGDYAELSGFGMRALASSLALKDDWGRLYDSDSMRRALGDGGPCKAAAAVYYEDMYVEFNECMKVASRGGPLERCKVWITNDYQHSGLRDNGANIFTKLLGMAKGTVGTPS